MRRAVVLLIPTLACFDATTGEVANAPVPTAAPARVLEARRVFSTGLTATGDARRAGASPKTFARGRVELKVRKDGTLEYHLNVYNPANENFTAAQIFREDPRGRATPPVVTLFSGASVKDKYIQVRGTAMIVDPAGSAVIDELRASPGRFYVSLRTSQEPRGALRGTIH